MPQQAEGRRVLFVDARELAAERAEASGGAEASRAGAPQGQGEAGRGALRDGALAGAGARVRELPPAAVEKVVRAVAAFLADGRAEREEGFAAAAPLGDVLDKEADLRPDIYVGASYRPGSMASMRAESSISELAALVRQEAAAFEACARELQGAADRAAAL